MLIYIATEYSKKNVFIIINNCLLIQLILDLSNYLKDKI
jgi:hypothetical protein